MRKNKIWLLFIALLIIALLFGAWLYYNRQQENVLDLQKATVLNQPRILSNFQLIDDHGKSFSNKNLTKHWTLLFFGFTHCPDLCPTSLAILKDAYQKMQALKLKPLPQVVFISVDPERDTAAVIRRYLTSFDPQFIGATGSEQQLKKLTQEMTVVYMKVMQKNASQAHYTIDHSGTILVTDPKGELYALFTLPHDAAAIAHDMKSIIKHYQATNKVSR